jgi:transcriptional antiterminator NusG
MSDENNTTPDAAPPATPTPAEAEPAAPAGPEAAAAEPPAPPPAEQLIAADQAHAEAAHTLPAPGAPDQPETEPEPAVDEAAAAETPPPGETVPDQAAAAESEPQVPPPEVAPEAAEAPEAPPEPEPTEEQPPEPPPAALEAPPAPPPGVAPAPAPKKPRKSKAAVAAATETEPAATPTEGEPAEATAESVPAEPAAEPAPESKKKWYAVKVQSGREESIKAAIERKIKIEGLEPYFGQILIPVEELIVKKKVKVKNKKTGETTTQEKNVSKYNKKFPGYLFAEVEFNDEILYVFRETSGVGDFVGASLKRAPAPMTDAEVQSMLTGIPDKTKKRGAGKVVVKLDVEKGDKVRIKNGAFAGNEGEVKAVTEPKDPTDTPKVTVVVTLWGRPVDVDLDYWEVDKV